MDMEAKGRFLEWRSYGVEELRRGLGGYEVMSKRECESMNTALHPETSVAQGFLIAEGDEPWGGEEFGGYELMRSFAVNVGSCFRSRNLIVKTHALWEVHFIEGSILGDKWGDRLFLSPGEGMDNQPAQYSCKNDQCSCYGWIANGSCGVGCQLAVIH